jgi:predicted negative regulator of RcsB-dependent stress response
VTEEKPKDDKAIAPDLLEKDSGSDDPIESMFSYVTENWKELVGGVVIAAILVGSYAFYQHKSRATRERSFTQLAVANSAAQLNEIVAQFPSSKAAELASFMVARSQYDAGKFTEADQIYADFLKKYPGHFLAPAARLGRLHCQEAAGQFEESLKGFQQFAGENQGLTAFAIMARLGEARCLRQMGKLQEAVAVYENLLVGHPESEWQAMIEDLKASTTRDLERLSKPVKLAAPAAS